MHCGPPKQNFGWAMAHPRHTLQLPTWGLGSAVSSSSGVRGGAPTTVAFCCIVYSQNTSGCSIFGSLVSIADCNEQQNESQSRLRSNLLSGGNIRHINIIVVQTGKLIFVGFKFVAPLNFVALFGRTTRTCLRPALNVFNKCSTFLQV